jgi:hypothetical protein
MLASPHPGERNKHEAAAATYEFAPSKIMQSKEALKDGWWRMRGFRSRNLPCSWLEPHTEAGTSKFYLTTALRYTHTSITATRQSGDIRPVLPPSGYSFFLINGADGTLAISETLAS